MAEWQWWRALVHSVGMLTFAALVSGCVNVRAPVVLNASFELHGQQFMAMAAGPHFRFAEGISLFVDCKTQEEVDRLYDGLAEDGEKQPCGWVKDKFGVSWQIVPSVLGQLMGDPDRAKAQRVMEAMMTMHKMDIATLQRAYDQG